jgi:hypothetical protein
MATSRDAPLRTPVRGRRDPVQDKIDSINVSGASLPAQPHLLRLRAALGSLQVTQRNDHRHRDLALDPNEPIYCELGPDSRLSTPGWAWCIGDGSVRGSR